MSNSILSASASGRLCLLGEHADYLGLEVISLPLDRHITILGQSTEAGPWVLHLDDIGQTRTIDPNHPALPRPDHADYILAGIHRLLKKGRSFPTSYHIRVNSNIPIGKGVSSSSAFCVAWMDFLHKAADPPQNLTHQELAQETYEMEVLDFQQAGGMQDQYTIAYGQLIHLDCEPPFKVTPLPAKLTGLIVGDSGVTKDTQGVLARIRGTVEGALDKARLSKKALQTLSLSDLQAYKTLWSEEEMRVLGATLQNRDQARRGRQLLEQPTLSEADQKELGSLMHEHHNLLKTHLCTSTETIDKAIEVALAAGAYGGKVVGSGGGGCFIVYAPQKTKAVVQALLDAGIEARQVD